MISSFFGSCFFPFFYALASGGVAFLETVTQRCKKKALHAKPTNSHPSRLRANRGKIYIKERLNDDFPFYLFVAILLLLFVPFSSTLVANIEFRIMPPCTLKHSLPLPSLFVLCANKGPTYGIGCCVRGKMGRKKRSIPA